MTVLDVDGPMAEAKPKTSSVKLRTPVVESARIVAAFTGEQITDMLSDMLEPLLAKREREEIAKRSKGSKAP